MCCWCTGIDDATNTARLCHRMVRDGCRLSITKCIHKLVGGKVGRVGIL